MSESDEYDEGLEMKDEVDDSTTLSIHQEGLRKENLVWKGSVLSTVSQKKGRLIAIWILLGACITNTELC